MHPLRTNDPKAAAMFMVRFAVAMLFFWFGVSKLIHPALWSGWIPSWTVPLLPVSVETFLRPNGIFEIAIAAAFVSGKFLRLAAALAALFLAALFVMLGANEITLRDGVAFGGAVAVFISSRRDGTMGSLERAVLVVTMLALVAVGAFYFLAQGVTP